MYFVFSVVCSLVRSCDSRSRHSASAHTFYCRLSCLWLTIKECSKWTRASRTKCRTCYSTAFLTFIGRVSKIINIIFIICFKWSILILKRCYFSYCTKYRYAYEQKGKWNFLCATDTWKSSRLGHVLNEFITLNWQVV